MKKKFLLSTLAFIGVLTTYGQVTKYQIGKYKATIDFNKMRIKWDKGATFSQILEIETSEKNVRRFQEIEYGKVTGTFETYYISDGETDGVYTRRDGKEFIMKILNIKN